MAIVPKSLLAAAAFLMTQTALAQTTTYQYTGNPFTFFSCGPSNPGPGTLDCFNAPAPRNTLTSYTATDHVAATLSFSAPLPANLNYQDVKSFAGFQLSMSDGHQTLVSGTPTAAGGVIARVSTDAVGQIVGPWLLVINEGNTADSGIATENEPPVQPFVSDSGVLACCDPTVPGDIGEVFNHAGTWTGAGGANGLTFGGFTRVIQYDAYDHDDFTAGGLGTSVKFTGTGSEFGVNWASATFKPITLMTPTGPVVVNNGPAAGAWSDSNLGSGSGRGLAFTTFTAPLGGVTFRVNAVLDGEFDHDPFGLPDGTLAAGAEVLVADTDLLNAAITARNQTPAAFFMGTGTVTQGIVPSAAFDNLRSALGSALLIPPAAVAPIPGLTPFGTDVTYPISTQMVTVPAGKQFTVILDVAAFSVVGGFVGFGAGTGDANFVRTLQPAANFFTDANGNPVVGITPVGPAPALVPTAANIALAASQPSALVGTAATLTATVTDTTSAPLAGVLVMFQVTAGPDAGLNGGGITDASGRAVFTYTGMQGAGTDTVQASIAAVTSNLASETWTLAPLTDGATCNGTFNGTFSGNVKIASGQNCVLLGGQVTGNVLVTGGSLSLSRFTVGGNLQVQGGSVTTGPLVTVNGNFQVQNLPGGGPASRVCNTVVQGNLLLQSNAAAVQVGGDLTCPGNTIAGNLLVQDNAGAVQVSGNTAGKNLDCSGNSSLTGSGNTANQKLGQCAAF